MRIHRSTCSVHSELLQALRATASRRVEITERRRLMTVAVPGLIPLFMLLIMAAMPLMPAWYRDLGPDLEVYRLHLAATDSLLRQGVADSTAA